MRVTWLVVCEKIIHLRGARLSAMNIYLDEVPWNGPGIGIPFSVMLAIEPLEEEAPAHELVLRVLAENGRAVDETTGKLPSAAPGEQGKAIIEGFLELEEPGHYTVEVLLDGIPLDDAPRWPLHIVDKK